jgi:predicted phosphoribosyltransferase
VLYKKGEILNRYCDRREAGKILAQALQNFKNQTNTIVLALPRGGVPVAFEIAQELSQPLDIIIVRKLGVPGHEELAMGAIAMDGTVVFNSDIVGQLDISSVQIKKIIDKEIQEIARRNLQYRKNSSMINVTGKTVILVDDGIATGATMRAAVTAINKQHPLDLIIAVPVADPEICRSLEKDAKIICPLMPESLLAVGNWYVDFRQTSDEEVITLLQENLGKQ